MYLDLVKSTYESNDDGNLLTSKSLEVQVSGLSACCSFRRHFFIVFFREAILKLWSVILSLGAILFHRVVDRETKFSVGVLVMIVVSFLWDILN